MKKIVFTGGGSAGHVIPNLALMQELKYTHSLVYMGTGGIEMTLVKDFPFLRVDCPKLVRGFSLQNFAIPYRLHVAKRQALALLAREQPDLVFSKGGYASYPAVWAANKLHIPVLTHESDLSAGLCTRLIARKCVHVLTSFPETAEKFANGVFTGSPIRREILAADRARARKKFGISEDAKVLLVFGGGSGSRALNEAVSTWRRHLRGWTVFHIAGKDAKEVQTEYYLCKKFETDMGSAYAAADVVLSRAGSNTVFELLALQKPSVLVPLAHASRGDQAENAAYFEKKGLAYVLPEEHLADLCEKVEKACSDEGLKNRLREANICAGNEKIIGEIKRVLG